MKAIPPGQWLGLLGGGQLGRMFTQAAQSMGYEVAVVDPGDQSPAGAVASRHIRADYQDPAALKELASLCRAVTTEFENVPAQALKLLSRACVVSPPAESVAVAQDRICEKRFLKENDFEVAPFAVIQAREDLTEETVSPLLPGILKISRLGYDGKGQIHVHSVEEAWAAFVQLGDEACVLEKKLDLKLEISVVVARNHEGKTLHFPAAENYHENGILDLSIVPARISPSLSEAASEAAMRVAQQLDYQGVLCVEFFVLEGERLLINEIAPRPHNSGHYTLDACLTSQFEQQVRTLCGLSLGSTALHSPAVMVNLLGDLWSGGEPDWVEVLRHPNAKLHLYGKKEARTGRKMGHYTVLDASLEKALALALQIKEALQRPHAAKAKSA